MTATRTATFKTLPEPRRASVITTSPQVAAQARIVLMALGWCVTYAADAAELAVQLLKGDRPGLIVADRTLPVMDGEQLVQALAADARFRAIPALVVNRGVGMATQLAEFRP